MRRALGTKARIEGTNLPCHCPQWRPRASSLPIHAALRSRINWRQRIQSLVSLQRVQLFQLTLLSANPLGDHMRTGDRCTHCLTKDGDSSHFVRTVHGGHLPASRDPRCKQSADPRFRLSRSQVEEPALHNNLLPGLPGYSAHYYGRPPSQTDPVPGPVEGAALLTRDSRLKVLSHRNYR